MEREEDTKMVGCYSCMFGGGSVRRSLKHRRSSSTSSLPRHGDKVSTATLSKIPSSGHRRHHHRPSPSVVGGSSNGSSTALVLAQLPPSPAAATARKSKSNNQNLKQEAPPRQSVSTELETMLYDHKKSKVGGSLVRATSGNVMLYGNLGNIRVPPKNGLLENGVAGKEENPAALVCRNKGLDCEDMKRMGNEEFKKRNFGEALKLYERAIAVEPGNAACRSNKATALMRMGMLLESVVEFNEALKIDPQYFRAHYRLATLYLRLGEVQKAIEHFKLSQKEAKPEEIAQAQALHDQLRRCNEARKHKDWNGMLVESQSITTSGADSAPQAYALLAEALLKLHRHDDAILVWKSAPRFETSACTNFFGSKNTAYFLSIKAQVDIATGRFEDGVQMAQKACEIDPGNHEITVIARRIKVVSAARSKGNEHFNACRYGDACIAYTEGLENEPKNAVLSCNRAACHAKLSNWEKALDDCDAALSVRPSFSKARLRRADCKAKMEKWEAAIEDYEALIKETPGDEEIKKALNNAREQLSKKNQNVPANRRTAQARSSVGSSFG